MLSVQSVKRMTRSKDEECKYRAVKCLMLLAQAPANVEVLVQNGVLEALYDASRNSEPRTAKAAWDGMRTLAANPARMLAFAQHHADVEEEYEVQEYVFTNRSQEQVALRLNCPLQGRAKVYYEVLLTGEGDVRVGFSRANTAGAADADAARFTINCQEHGAVRCAIIAACLSPFAVA